MFSVAVLKRVATGFSEDKLPRLASAIAYTAIFSIAPLFIILIAVVGWVLGIANGGHAHHIVQTSIVGEIRRNVGDGAAAAVQQMIAASFDKPRQSIWAQIIGWIAFAAGAGALFSTLQDALNSIWHVEEVKGGWKQALRDRGASFGMIIVIGFLMLLSFIASVAFAFAGEHLGKSIPLLQHPLLLAAVGQLVTLAIVTLLFAALFKTLPDVDISWGDTWAGAAVTAVLFVIGEVLITTYLRVAAVASAYGAAGSLLVALIWIYYSALIVLIGAEFTKAIAENPKTSAPASLSNRKDHPAGVDPRNAGSPS